MRFVAVTARHSGTIHLALQKRAIDIDFILHLAIGMVQTGVEEAWQMGLHERPSRKIVLGEQTAAGVAVGAQFDLDV
jgi:hypothetical protein